MELNERETLVKVEQQLQDSMRNQGQITNDQKEIFNRIESESKIVASINADVKILKENSNLRLVEIEKRLTCLENNCVAYDKNLTEEIANRKEAMNDEAKARESFELTIKASYRTTVIILGVIIIIIGAIVSVIEIVKYMKGS